MKNKGFFFNFRIENLPLSLYNRVLAENGKFSRLFIQAGVNQMPVITSDAHEEIVISNLRFEHAKENSGYPARIFRVNYIDLNHDFTRTIHSLDSRSHCSDFLRLMTWAVHNKIELRVTPL